jgi:hypothetical protein
MLPDTITQLIGNMHVVRFMGKRKRVMERIELKCDDYTDPSRNEPISKLHLLSNLNCLPDYKALFALPVKRIAFWSKKLVFGENFGHFFLIFVQYYFQFATQFKQS